MKTNLQRMKKNIRITRIGNEFHREPFGGNYKTALVPARVFEEYVEIRTAYLEFKKELDTYFQPVIVKQNEVHKFA